MKKYRAFFVDRKLARIVVSWDHYPIYVDLLCNDKLVYGYLNSDRTLANRIYTGREPVGEEED